MSATGEPVSLRQLAELYAVVGQAVSAVSGMNNALAAVTEVAVRNVPGATSASVTRSRGDHFQTLAPTSSTATAGDRLQYEVGSGPCVDAVSRDGVFLVHDLRTDPRWPEFGPRAYDELGIVSMLSIRLVLDEDNIRAGLNLYADEEAAFDETSLTVAMVVAAHGAVAVSRLIARDRGDNLFIALMTGRRIGIALGVLMSKLNVTDTQAFDLLRVASQTSNIPVAQLCEQVIESGELEVRSAAQPR